MGIQSVVALPKEDLLSSHSTGGHPGEPGAKARTGSVVAGRYQVDKLIARGGMATVYLAHQVGLNRPVALKVLAPPPDADDAAAFENRFHLEARALASLSHPNIVTVYDFGETDDGRYYLAMEFIDGPKFSDLLRDGPLAAEEAIPLVLQVCTGLRYAHKRHVVHRDLKPSNILVKRLDDGEDEIKLVDFGLVKLTVDDQSITRAGLILGSPHCMAPEQVKGGDVDQRADIYAVGVLLFRTLTGHYPFHGPNSAATMIAHLNQEVPTFFSVAPHLVVPEGLEDIVRRCLAKDPRDRFQDMRELMEGLAGCMQPGHDGYRSYGSYGSQPSSMLSGNSSIQNQISGARSQVTPAPRPQMPQHSGIHGQHSQISGMRSQVTGVSGAHSQITSGVRSGVRNQMISGAHSSPSGDYSSVITSRPNRMPIMIMAFAVGTPLFLGTLVLGAALGGAFNPFTGAAGTGSVSAPAAQTRAAPGLAAEGAPTGQAAPSLSQTLEPAPAEGAEEAPAAAPKAAPAAAPAPAPRPRPRRRAAPKPAPSTAAPAPATTGGAEAIDPPKPAPKADKKADENAPEGYMGVPDDLFE